MGKLKKKLRKAVTRVSHVMKTTNPFELHVNRQKHNVIGRKLKADKGLPGFSRAKAIKKRKVTLLQEFKVKDKSNKFLDRRIGEKNSAMTPDDRVMARFATERMKTHHKKSMYNLADDEILTHHGQSLNEIERFDDPRSDDDDEEDQGKLDSVFVEDAHFGGGLFKKTHSDEKLSRKDLIEQLIAESKKRKAEKQRAREQTIQLTEKLDLEWKDLFPIVSTDQKYAGEDKEIGTKPDSYDTVMRELKFEARGKPSDPLKSEETLAQQEKDRLERLITERQKRMYGFSDESVLSCIHRSADDLDDGFEMLSGSEMTVSYDAEGLLRAHESTLGSEPKTDPIKEAENEESSSTGENEESETDSGRDMNENEEDSLSDLKNISSSESEFENVKAIKLESCKFLETENNKLTEESNKSISNLATERVLKQNSQNAENKRIIEDKVQQQSMNEQEKVEFIETAKQKFPHISEVPDSYEDLWKILSLYNAEDQAIIVENILKCNHPSLKESNRSKLETMFAYLLQLLHDSSKFDPQDGKNPNCFSVLSCLAPYLYDLAHISPRNAYQCIIEVLKEKQMDFRKQKHTFPHLDTLIFLKLISLLFPTSDFRHPIVTPALVFMCQMLLQCRVRKKRDISVGLFIVTLILEYTVLSKRFSPAAINFLRGVVYLAVNKTKAQHFSIIPPFRSIKDTSNLLVLTEKQDKEESCQCMLLSDLTSSIQMDNGFKVRALYAALGMLNEFQSHLDPLLSSYEIFEPILLMLDQLHLDKKYPRHVIEELRSLKQAVEKMGRRKMQLLVVERKKAKTLRLYEPNIEKVYDCKKRKPMGKDKQEHEKLLHRYKREHKAVVREIRQDNAFIAKLKFKQAIRSDLERKQRVKEIYGSAAMQQGELRQLKRRKK